VAMMVVFCLLLSPIMSALRERSGSVLGAAIAHGSVNATAGLGLVLAASYAALLLTLAVITFNRRNFE